MSCHFWIETMTEDEVVDKIKKYISANMSLDEDSYGNYSFDTYINYDEELSSQRLKEIFESDYPEDTYYEMIANIYDDFETCDEIIRQLQNQFEEGYHEYISDWVIEHVYQRLPYEHFLKKTVCIDITVDTGDANYDYTLNSFSDGKINKLASTVWLAKQQGYTKTEVENAYNFDDYYGKHGKQSIFLKSLTREYINENSHINTLTFLVKMSLADAIKLVTAKRHLEGSMTEDERYNPIKNKNRSYIILGKNTETGLIDFWNGSGSLLEIELEKDVKLPLKYVNNIYPDECYDYGFKRIYGCGSLFYRNALKETKLYGAANILY